MMVRIRPGAGADELRWVQCQVVKGGDRLADVKVQFRRGKLGIPEEVTLDSERIEGLQHPDACNLPQLESLMRKEVDRLHGCLGADGRLLGLPAGEPEEISGFKLAPTHYSRVFSIQQGTLPGIGCPMSFWKKLESFVSLLPEERAAAAASAESETVDGEYNFRQRSSVMRPCRVGDTVRCFAAFECETCPPAFDSDFTVKASNLNPCRADDPRLGHYHQWDENRSKFVYKKYGSQMYVYVLQGSDLEIDGVKFDLLDYKHSQCRVFKAQDEELYLFHEWYRNPNAGRWILGPQVRSWPRAVTFEETDFFAYTDSDTWQWPPEGLTLRWNKDQQRLHGNFFTSVQSGEPLKVASGNITWAFGTEPGGRTHLGTAEGYAGEQSPPYSGWDGVECAYGRGRRFASSMVMAKCVSRGRFTSLQGHSLDPTKGCQECFEQAISIFIEQFDPNNPEHILLGPHKTRLCLECFRFGDWCSHTARHGMRVDSPNEPAPDSFKQLLPWMSGRTFLPCEAGLETTVEFKGVKLTLLCVPDLFALEESVFMLGARAQQRDNNRHVFDTAFELLNDRSNKREPQKLSEALLLLNCQTNPEASNMLCVDWQNVVGRNAAASASLIESMQQRLASDVEARALHLDQKNAIAQILMDSYGMDSEPVAGDPHGWLLFPVAARQRHRRAGRDTWEGDTCYHGTGMAALAPILASGLKRPGDGQVAHGQSGSRSRRSIYLSPSWHYAAHPVYSPLHRLSSIDAFQMVLRCSARQGCYRKQRGTLASKHWDRTVRIDPELDTIEDLEFLVEDEADVKVIGVMFRKLGETVDATIFGELPKKLKVPSSQRKWKGARAEKGVEYMWTNLLQEEYKQQGLYLSVPENDN